MYILLLCADADAGQGGCGCESDSASTYDLWDRRKKAAAVS